MGGQRNALKLSMSPEERKLITFIIWGRAIRSGRGISKRIGGWMLTGKWVRFPYTPQKKTFFETKTIFKDIRYVSLGETPNRR